MGRVRETVKTNLGSLFGCSRCRFKVADRRNKDEPADLFEVQTADRVLHGIGYVMTLGVGGLVNKGVKQFHLRNVDMQTLLELRSKCTEKGLTYNEIMGFLMSRGYMEDDITEEAHYGWVHLVIKMKKTEYVCVDGVCTRVEVDLS